jgi:copper transport protein
MAVILLIVSFPEGAAHAHANLDRSEPAQGAALAQSPKEVLLHFTEGLDPSFSSVELLDASGKTIIAGPGTIDASDARTLRLPLGILPDGIYSAVWKARSAVDGHITQGVVSFSVGLSSPRVSLLPPPGTPDPATALPSLADSLARGLSYLAAAITVGSLLFGILIWQPVYRKVGGSNAADRYASDWLRRLIRIGIVGLIAATLAFAVVQALQASVGSSLWQAMQAYLTTRSALLLGIRVCLLATLSMILDRLPRLGAGAARGWWIGAALGLSMLLTFSLQSHAAASGEPLAVIVDWVHLGAMSAWMGGLPALAVLIVHSRRSNPPHTLPLDKLIPRFSRIALISVDFLAATGVYSLLMQVRTTDALVETTYGRTLILKIGFFALLLALGAVNLLVISPRLKQASAPAGSWLGRTVPTEIALGLLVLLATGVLTSISPAYDALEAQHRLGFVEATNTDGVNLTLRIAPAQVGDNEFGIDVFDPRPDASATPATVVLRLELIGKSLGITQLETTTADGKRYSARGTYFALGGQWQVEVILRRSGFDDIDHRFLVSVAGPGGSAVAPLTGVQESTLPNPIQPDAASVAAGNVLFVQNCQPCHGATGKGDGPIGLTLNPRPADLNKHAAPGVHTDGQLYEWITTGYPDSAMPAFGPRLSDTDRWNLVNYIRTLAQS